MKEHSMAPQKKYKSVQVQIGLILVSLTTILLLGFGIFQYFKLQSSKKNDLKERAVLTVERMAGNLALALWNLDEEQIEKAMLAEMKEQNIYGILVRDEGGNIVGGRVRDEEWEISDTDQDLLEKGMVESRDIVRFNEKLGTVDLHMTLRFIQAELRRELRNILLMVIGVDILLFGLLSHAIRRILIRPIDKLLVIAHAISQGHLDQTFEAQQNNEIGQLANAFQTMIEQLRVFAVQIKSTSNEVASGSRQVSSSAAQMSDGANQQAAAAEEASSSMEEMAANIRQNTENALQTEHIAVKVAEDALESGQAVENTVMAIQQIARKVATIQDITRQTRMLSLNATIEAARVQEYGKGFAVVAAEVRSLAERSQSAAAEITELAQVGVSVAERAGGMLEKLVPDIQKTAELVQEISAASKEQNMGADQINRALQQLDNVTQQNAASSEEIAATAERFAAQAEELKGIVSFFKISQDQVKHSSGIHTASEDSEKTPQRISTKAESSKASSSLNDLKNDTPTPLGIQDEVIVDEHDDDFERY